MCVVLSLAPTFVKILNSFLKLYLLYKTGGKIKLENFIQLGQTTVCYTLLVPVYIYKVSGCIGLGSHTRT